MKEHGYGRPCGTDPLEGWIADPSLRQTALSNDIMTYRFPVD
jgi:hypothetical protein